MKKFVIGFISTLCILAVQAEAADLKNISLQDAMASDEAKLNLPDDVKFYFGDATPTGTVTKTIGEYTFNRQVNVSLKSQINGCHAALVSALKDLREAAKKDGANAVINIKTNAKGKASNSKEIYVCEAGVLKSAVSISGDLVVIE